MALIDRRYQVCVELVGGDRHGQHQAAVDGDGNGGHDAVEWVGDEKPVGVAVV